MTVPFSIRVRYSEGECELLAQAIAHLTGWEVVLVSDDGCDSGHAMVQLPDGRLLDVRGVHDATDLRALCPVAEGPAHNQRVWFDADRHRSAGLPEPVLVPYAESGWTRYGAFDPNQLQHARIVLDAYDLT